VQRARQPLVILASDDDVLALDRNGDFRPVGPHELAELALDGHFTIGDVHLNAVEDRNWFFAYTGHVLALSCKLLAISQTARFLTLSLWLTANS
jgi:hypothetical protein